MSIGFFKKVILLFFSVKNLAKIKSLYYNDKVYCQDERWDAGIFKMLHVMAKEKLVKSITSMEEDFAKWYTDVCIKAELVDYASVKGCMIIRPYGYAIWENIQKQMDAFVYS